MRRFWLAPVMLAGAVLYAGFDSESGLRAWANIRSELGASRERADATQAEIDRLALASRRLHGDPFAMEAAIRVDLELSRPGETIVRFLDHDGSSAGNP
ncbi:MAG: septum formation initiator family protein [Deltaproteobacteria bacterium]|nr:septum formation initiator family protein [Deltaproteobacteria bacterium]MBW2446450.1 septum formation initiator family protein [Deltaproteobacteria bacterium]